MSNKIAKIGQWGFVIITFALLLYRITLHADPYDEIMNLNISYRIVLGDIPFYHIQESYQTGAVFLVPFLWIFVKLTGGTTGIVLYSRVVYILVLAGSAVLAYRMFKRYMDKENAFFLSYTIVFFELFSLFYLWYDSVAVIFFLLGDFAIIKAMRQKRFARKKYLYLALAGLLHSCMVFAHVALIPMALGIAALIGILVYRYYRKDIGKVLRCVWAYGAVPIAGVMSVLFAALLTSNLGTLFNTLISMLTSRGLGSESINFWEIINSVIESYVSINGYFIKISVVLLCIYVLSWFLPKLFPILAFGIVILPIYNQFLLPETSVRGLPNYLSYLALWCPFLYLMVQKKAKTDRCLFYILWVPILLSVVFIPLFSLTGTYGPVKAWQMCLPGALATLYYMVRVWRQRVGQGSMKMCQFLYMLVTLALLLNAYKFVYLNQPMIESDDTRITEGIYWGIKVNPEMEYMAELQEMVETYSEGCETILASGEIRPIYLMTDLKPFTRTTENATFFDGDIRRWRLQKEYFAKFNDLPDIMFLESYDLQDEYFWDILNTDYELTASEIIGGHEIFVYKKIGL